MLLFAPNGATEIRDGEKKNGGKKMGCSGSPAGERILLQENSLKEAKMGAQSGLNYFFLFWLAESS